ncbi:dynamin-related protein 4C-like protein [Tanacetum coccineum]|uniref:Dynamin-related protein 4C-like protein n=1 Tax=Tanacetum coccineum TaxID=301880 RepID=A0ABQ5CUU9_9ASTR
MRLQHHPDDVPEYVLEYKDAKVKIDGEHGISEAIDKATIEVAGNCKGVENVPLTLVVKKRNVPDLMMVDLPGITRVPVGDQPKDIYVEKYDESSGGGAVQQASSGGAAVVERWNRGGGAVEQRWWSGGGYRPVG